MLREGFKEFIGMNKDFRYRGAEPGRLENFSDAVFALAITLLLISTSPPTNFSQIKRFIYDLVPFVMCICVIILIWHEHFTFFFRYGLRNGKILVFNTILLVIILFYVYPLKFLTKLILIPISVLIQNESLFQEISATIESKDIGLLMIIYGLGATSIFFMLALMYRYAYKLAEELELNEIERLETRMSMESNILMGSIPIASVLVSAIFINHWAAGMLSGFTYVLYTPVMTIHGRRVKRKREALKQRLIETTSATSEVVAP